jgi:glucose-1-phosphate adenylyltransferase
MHEALAVILAGGKGSRLDPLTRDRAKPAVPFGGLYRIIDFTLSNCLNSGLKKVVLLTQYKAMSLDRHINHAWRHYFVPELGEFCDIVPPQQRVNESWYLGTADAVYQNIYSLEKERPKYVIILSGDHIYKMNYRSMLDFHEAKQADLTIGVLQVDLAAGRQFGVMQINEHQRVTAFQEKPQEPRSIPGDPDHCLASMGIYIFNASFLYEQLLQDATLPHSDHDFGKNIIPSVINSHRVFAFPFHDENRKREAYWRDVGTLDSYYTANMDLVSIDPQLNLYDRDWPVRTFQPQSPPAKFVFGSRGEDRVGQTLDSIVCQGSIISGASVRRSILGPQCRVNSYADVEESILFDGVDIGRRARIRRAIIDKGVRIPADCQIGYDLELDRSRGFTISDQGIVVIAKDDSIRIPSS